MGIKPNTAKPGLAVRLARHKNIAKFLTYLNVCIYKLSGGRIMNRINGCPVCLVTMTGHKSGNQKTIALMYTPFDEKVLLVASFGGAAKHPAWYHNLVANPMITIQKGTVKRTMSARIATQVERPEVWALATANFPPYIDYQTRTEREIPVFICSPC